MFNDLITATARGERCVTSNASWQWQMVDAIAKQRIFDELMGGDHAFVHLDARQEGVEVPAHLKSNPALMLKLSYHFQGEIARDDVAISASLRFSGNYFDCVLPWKSIWGFTGADQKQLVWPEDMPTELQLELAKQLLKNVGGLVPKSDEASAAIAAEESAEAKEAAEPPRKAGHLRRVK